MGYCSNDFASEHRTPLRNSFYTGILVTENKQTSTKSLPQFLTRQTSQYLLNVALRATIMATFYYGADICKQIGCHACAFDVVITGVFLVCFK